MLNSIADDLQQIYGSDWKKYFADASRVERETSMIYPVAYVRFASVYRQFKDVNTFTDELKTFLE